jgi:hypothetical protein
MYMGLLGRGVPPTYPKMHIPNRLQANGLFTPESCVRCSVLPNQAARSIAVRRSLIIIATAWGMFRAPSFSRIV